MMDRHPRFLPLAAAVVATSASLAHAADPQLGKSPDKDVIAAMTRDEKVGLVMGTGMSLPGLPPDMQAPVVGTAGRPAGRAWRCRYHPRDTASRDPSVVVADGPAGLRIQPTRKGDESRTYYCTAFPVATSLASSWDVDLVERVGRPWATRSRNTAWTSSSAPALNIHRNPLGGRNFEYYSEDPLVAGRDGGGHGPKGVQSQGVGPP